MPACRRIPPMSTAPRPPDPTPRVRAISDFPALVDQAVEMLSTRSADSDRIMCNTDSAIAVYSPLLKELAGDERLPQALRAEVLGETARRAFLPGG